MPGPSFVWSLILCLGLLSQCQKFDLGPDKIIVCVNKKFDMFEWVHPFWWEERSSCLRECKIQIQDQQRNFLIKTFLWISQWPWNSWDIIPDLKLRTESNRKLPILKWPGSGRCSLAPSVCYRIVEFNEALGLLPWPNLEYDCIRQGLLTRARPGIIIILRPGISQFARVCFDLMKPLDCGREGKFWEVKLISMRIWVTRICIYCTYIGRTFQL